MDEKLFFPCFICKRNIWTRLRGTPTHLILQPGLHPSGACPSLNHQGLQEVGMLSEYTETCRF